MFNNLKLKLGILFPVLMIFLICLLTITLSRLSLSIWQSERVAEVAGWTNILLSGLRIDISTLCYLFVLPSLLMCLLPGSGTAFRFGQILIKIWLVFILWLIVYMEIVTPPFISEYDVRPNRLFVEYLIYPKEVFAMLWGGYKLELFVGSVVSITTLIGGWKLVSYLMSGLSFPRWYWRPLIAVAVLLVSLIGGRSTLGHRPLNPSMVAFSSDPLINDLTLNSTYSLLFAVNQMKDEDNAFKYYKKMEEDKINLLVRQSTSLAKDNFVSDTQPTLARREATYNGKKNLVILLQESLGARYVSGLGGLPLTPNLDKIMQEGWNFTRIYATGTRSVRGIEAVLTGFPPTPARSVVKLAKSQSNFFTIAELLKNNGYHTQFIYGGESHFDNMKSFFLGNGFVDMQDFPTFKNPKFVGSWGASDEDLYEKAHEQFTQLDSQNKPFFSLVFTSSNHTPFEYPDGRISPFNSPKQTRENAAKYSDYALGEFIKSAKNSAYWENTVFIAIADHDSRAFGAQLVPIDHFKIPAVIFGSGISPRKDDRLTSQIDIPPTLMSLIGIDSTTPMIGHDMTKDVEVSKLRAMMQYHKNFAWMNNKSDVVIFQPEKPIQSYHYDTQTLKLTEKKLASKMIDTALANALWGSLAYKKDYYQSTDKTNKKGKGNQE